MSNLDARNKMTSLQLALVIALIGSGISFIRAPAVLVNAAGQAGWITAILAVVPYYLGMYLIVRLMNRFPGKSLIDFLPDIIGKTGTYVFVWIWVLIIWVHMSFRIQSFGREMTFFLFDRTPLEVVILTFLLCAAYGGVQDWGTLLRVAQLVFFVVVPLLALFIGFSAINLHTINLFPLFPQEPLQVILGIPEAWELYSGYELLIVLLPLTELPSASLLRYTAGAFLLRMLLILVSTITTIGVLTAEGIKATTYPTLLAVRLAELPGTFLERLDNYLLLSWIPIASITVSIYMYCTAKLLADLHKYSDHRPFALATIPVIFFAAMSLHDIRAAAKVQELGIWLGLAMSFGAVPCLLFIAWLRKRSSYDPPNSSV